jgi:putative flippase GtrA
VRTTSFSLLLAMQTRRKVEPLRQRLLTPAKFAISGALNTTLTYIMFLCLTHLVGSSTAYTLTYVAGIAIAYLMNTLFVFKTGHNKGMAIAVPVWYLVQYVYGLAALNMLIQILKLPAYIAIAIVIASPFPLQFLILQFAAGAVTPGNSSR